MRGPEQADIRPSTLQVREILLSQLPDLTHLPKTSAYRAELCHYWSLAIRQQRPAAIVQPTTTDQVAQIVRILNQFPDTPFAIKSGGHDPNVGDASTHGGILVSLRMMKGVDAYDPETKLAKIRPGGCWNDVIGDQKLESHGRTVVGGRLGAVGVGGYLMQGGISFLTWQYGMGADVSWHYPNMQAEMILTVSTQHRISSPGRLLCPTGASSLLRPKHTPSLP